MAYNNQNYAHNTTARKLGSAPLTWNFLT